MIIALRANLGRRPSRALDSPRVSLPELHRYKVTVRCARKGTEVLGNCQEQQTLIVRLFRTHFSTPILDWEKSEFRIELILRPDPLQNSSCRRPTLLLRGASDVSEKEEQEEESSKNKITTQRSASAEEGQLVQHGARPRRQIRLLVLLPPFRETLAKDGAAATQIVV